MIATQTIHKRTVRLAEDQLGSLAALAVTMILKMRYANALIAHNRVIWS